MCVPNFRDEEYQLRLAMALAGLDNYNGEPGHGQAFSMAALREAVSAKQSPSGASTPEVYWTGSLCPRCGNAFHAYGTHRFTNDGGKRFVCIHYKTGRTKFADLNP